MVRYEIEARGMTTQAAGTYLHLVRETVQQFTLEEVAKRMSTALGTSIKAEQLRRIEQGQPTTLDVLTAFAEAIGANIDHVTTLLAADSPMNAMIQSMVQVIRTQFDRSWNTQQKSSH
jgi:hypothetical protein